MSKQQQISGIKRKPDFAYKGENVPHTCNSLNPEEVDRISQLLQVDLAEEELSTRRGAGNKSFTYLESWRVLDGANKIFGFNGWSSSILSMVVERRKEGHKFIVKVNAIVRVTLKDGSYHEDVGVGEMSSAREVDAEFSGYEF